MNKNIIEFLSGLIEKVETGNLSFEENLTLLSIISLHCKKFPSEEKKIIKYLFTGWYIHENIQNSENETTHD